MKSKLTAYSVQLIETCKSCIPVFLLQAKSYKLQADSRGFTLIEVIVSTALFTIVILVAVGALLALVSANRKTQALHAVMNNLNIALDGMVRSIRMGSNYHCGGGGTLSPQDCPNGDSLFAFESFNGDPNNPEDQWVYSYDTDTKRIYKSEKSGRDWFPITAPSVTVDSVQFYVIGTTRGGVEQPKVVIEMKGTAGAESVKTKTEFHIQSTAVQRVLDL